MEKRSISTRTLVGFWGGSRVTFDRAGGRSGANARGPSSPDRGSNGGWVMTGGGRVRGRHRTHLGLRCREDPRVHELLRLGGGPLQERVIIRVHREGVSREGPREGLHRPAVHDRATGDLLAEPQELGHGDAVCVYEVGRPLIGPQGSRRYEGEVKKNLEDGLLDFRRTGSQSHFTIVGRIRLIPSACATRFQ